MDYVSRFKFNITTGELPAPSVQLISGGAIVTAPSSSSGHPAAHANDASYATYWEANNQNPADVGGCGSGRGQGALTAST